MERGLEGRMSWMEGGCWELDTVLCEARGWKRWVLRRGDVNGMTKKGQFGSGRTDGPNPQKRCGDPILAAARGIRTSCVSLLH